MILIDFFGIIVIKKSYENDLIDIENRNEDNQFTTPIELYDWLTLDKPTEDTCFIHEDYCPDNLFFNKINGVGFIDIGRAGIADRYQDITLCVRSIKHNLLGIEQIEKDDIYPYCFHF